MLSEKRNPGGYHGAVGGFGPDRDRGSVTRCHKCHKGFVTAEMPESLDLKGFPAPEES